MLCTSPVGPFFVCHGVRGPGGGVIGEPTFFFKLIGFDFDAAVTKAKTLNFTAEFSSSGDGGKLADVLAELIGELLRVGCQAVPPLPQVW